MSEITPNSSAKPADVTENDILKQIASEMAYNYFTCSFGKKPNREEDKEFERKQAEYVFSEEFMKNTFNEKKFERCRNIMIIGAGATTDSFGAIPKGSDTIELIDEYFGLGIIKNDNTKKRLEQEFSGSRMKTGDSDKKKDDNDINFDFENFLSFISRIVPEEDLREQIQQHFIHRCPTLFYEIVAHLFKHSFIDVIINFNFDELLDQAIEDELGKDYFRSIILDGECPEVDDIVVGGRLKVPIYIKPHGTAKHKSLLRFTKDHYLQLPEKIKSLIAELVSGSVGKEEDINDKSKAIDATKTLNKINQVNLICVGFNMQSIEFNEILEKNLPKDKDSKIFHFNRSKSPLSGNKLIDEKIVLPGINTKDKAVNIELNSPLGEEFRNLWKIIKEQFKSISPNNDPNLAQDEVPKYIEPRGIARHEIINYLFYNAKKSSDKEYLNYFKGTDYFKDRIIIEIAIALVRNNGVVEIQELLNERLGYFYEQYKQKVDKLEPIGDNNPRTFIDFCRIFELTNTYSFSKNLLNLPEQYFYDVEYLEDKIRKYKQSGKDNGLTKWINIFGRFWQANKANSNPKDKISIVVFNVIYLVLSSNKLSDEFKLNFKRISQLTIDDRRIKNIPMFENLLRLFHKINSSSYYDIFPNYYDKKHLIFESINDKKILNTDLSVKFNYNTIATDANKWDALLIISDSGNPLKLLKKNNALINFNKNVKKKVILICCYHSMKIKYFKELEKIKKELESNQKNTANYSIFKEFLQKHEQKLTNDFEKEGLNIDLKILTLPYWHHNHHMAFFLRNSKHHEDKIFPFSEDEKIKNKKWEFSGAIYFYKKGFTNSINPIFVGKLQNELAMDDDDQSYYNESIRNDSEKILSIFFSYKSAAEKYMEKEMKEMDVIDDTESIIKEEFKILNDFWKKNNT